MTNTQWLRRLRRNCARLAGLSQRSALLVVIITLLGSLIIAYLTAGHLSVNTNTSDLIAADAPWRQHEIAFQQAFPQLIDKLIIVIDAPPGESTSPEQLEQSASVVVERLSDRADLFHSIYWPDGDAFFRRHGLLFSSLDQLYELDERLSANQALLGSLAADSSLRGLFQTLNLSLEHGNSDQPQLDKALTSIEESLQVSLLGQTVLLSWQSLLSGETHTRTVVVAQPNPEIPGSGTQAMAVEFVQQLVQELNLEFDLRLRLTGKLAIQSDELRTVSVGSMVSIVISLALVSALLLLGLRSWRLILPVLVTLLVGLVLAGGFAALFVGELNLISITFAVLFIGLAVDFGIQLATRYREERFRGSRAVIERAAGGIGPSLALAAVSTSIGFFSFLPTSYLGVAQLGLITGVGILIALILNFSLLPALITLTRPRAESATIGYVQLAPLDRLILRWRRIVLMVSGLVVAAGLGLILDLRFDSNPINLREQDRPSIATALELARDGEIPLFPVEILADSRAQSASLADQLELLPQVHQAITIDNFIPSMQDEKLAILADIDFWLGPTLTPAVRRPVPDSTENRRAIERSIELLRLREIERLPVLLEELLSRGDEALTRAEKALLGSLPSQLSKLRTLLTVQPVTLDNLPQWLRRDWLTPSGLARIQVTPAGDLRDLDSVTEKAQVVLELVPHATGAGVTIRESTQTIVSSFIQAGITAAVVLFAILWLVSGRIYDAIAVLFPIVVAALLTVVTYVTAGLALNFANIIVLPILFGIGVAFNIYFVVNWRLGGSPPLQSSIARAVLFSALTTLAAFSSLMFSNHPGAASMGLLLLISVGYTLLTTFFVLPALLSDSTVSRRPGAKFYQLVWHN